MTTSRPNKVNIKVKIRITQAIKIQISASKVCQQLRNKFGSFQLSWKTERMRTSKAYMTGRKSTGYVSMATIAGVGHRSASSRCNNPA